MPLWVFAEDNEVILFYFSNSPLTFAFTSSNSALLQQLPSSPFSLAATMCQRDKQDASIAFPPKLELESAISFPYSHSQPERFF